MVKVLDSFDSRSEKKDKGYSKFMQPLQFLPTKEKDEEWRKQCMDWFEYVGEEQIKQKVNRLTKNYNLAAGVIDKNDYILDEDNENFELIEKLTDDDFSAYELKFYPIIPNVVNLLLGEFNKHAERITYVAVDDKSYNEYLEAKRAEIEKVLFEYGQQLMQQRIQAMGLDPNNQEHRAQIEEMLRPETIAKLKEIENFFRKDYQSLVEQWAVHQHNIDMERFDLTELERTAFYDALVTDSEFWHFKMNENDYDIEVLNPKYVFYCKPRNVKYISDGLYAGFIDFMTVADVIDKYGYMMTKEQLEALEEIGDVEDMKYALHVC